MLLLQFFGSINDKILLEGAIHNLVVSITFIEELLVLLIGNLVGDGV